MVRLNHLDYYRLPWNLTDNSISWLEPTAKCNLYCEGCYRSNEKDGHKTMAEINADLDVFQKLRNSDGVSIAGGDPLTHPDVIEIVREVKRRGMKPIVNTNGLALTKELLIELKKAGVFGFVRVIGFVFGPELFHDIGAGYILAGLAGATILLSSLLAMHQDNLKRRLAYSTVGHLSYIVLGVALLSPVAWMGGLLHIVNHAMMKITLFFCAGAIYVNTHIEKVSELDGIGKKMPITMLAFTIASLGLAGIPPINGFISKWFLGEGAVTADLTIFMVILLISGLLNAGYLFPVIRRAFFNKSEKHTKFGEASMFMVIPLVITALLSIFLGLVPNGIFHFFDLAKNAISSILGGGLI